MTKQEKFLLLVVLIVSGVGATLYVQNTKSQNVLKEQVQVGVQNTSSVGGVQGIVENRQTGAEISNTRAVSGNTQTGTNTNVVSETSVTSNTNNTISASNNTEQTPTKSVKQSSVNYSVPSGDVENISVVVTLSGKNISDISFKMAPTNSQSVEYYNSFKNSFPKSQIIGKSLDNVSLSRVGGASLTTNAFNKAIIGLRG